MINVPSLSAAAAAQPPLFENPADVWPTRTPSRQCDAAGKRPLPTSAARSGGLAVRMREQPRGARREGVAGRVWATAATVNVRTQEAIAVLAVWGRSRVDDLKARLAMERGAWPGRWPGARAAG